MDEQPQHPFITNGIDRRRSPRWALDKELRWRLFRGRRVRLRRIIERSLQGLIVSAARSDVPRPGARIIPCDPDAIDELGFRSAVVKRVQIDGAHNNLVIAEIEA